MAERAIVAYSHSPDPGSIPVFPSEACPGITFSFEDTVAFSGRYFALYERVHEALLPRWARRMDLPPDIASVFLRPTIVALTHLFWDRLLRLRRLLRSQAPEGLFVAEAPPLGTQRDIDDILDRMSYSVEANQSLLCWLAPLHGLATRPHQVEDPFLSVHRTPAGFVNYNYSLTSLLERARKGANRLRHRALGMARAESRGVPALSMAYDTAPLEAAGLLGRGALAVIDFKPFRGGDPLPDPGLRADIFEGTADLLSPGLRDFLAENHEDPGLGLQGAAGSFSRFLSLMTPPNMLEGVPSRLQRVKDLLSPFKGRPVVMQELGHLDSWYMTAAARSLGMETVGCQHGGGPGNLDHMRSVAELEYHLCDRFITRGWRRFLLPNPNPRLRAIPLPNPWLSERAKIWRRRMRLPRWPGLGPSFDLLFMSDKVLPFPRPGMGLDALASDQLTPQSALLRSLVEEASAAGLTVLHKPANRTTARLLERTFDALPGLGGGRYTLEDGSNKGLSPKLVSSCGMIVWDKPSSGFSECTAAGIPTMVLWPRFSSIEPPWAEGVFRALEETGVVHRRAERLCREYLRFRESPRAWMRGSARVRALARFRRRYAWARPDWARYWKKLLDSFRGG